MLYNAQLRAFTYIDLYIQLADIFTMKTTPAVLLLL